MRGGSSCAYLRTLGSRTITGEVRTIRKLKPARPGDLLLEEFLIPMGLSNYRLAKEIRVPAQRIGEIVVGKRSIPIR